MHSRFGILTVSIALALGITSCSVSELTVEESSGSGLYNGPPLEILDENGDTWDVTRAFVDYGLQSEKFDFGLGIDAIVPLIQPTLISSGDRGFPGAQDRFLVIATVINGDARAYGKFDIIQNEVVDEIIGNTPVAVAY